MCLSTGLSVLPGNLDTDFSNIMVFGHKELYQPLALNGLYLPSQVLQLKGSTVK